MTKATQVDDKMRNNTIAISKVVDVAYLTILFFFMACNALRLVRRTFIDVNIPYIACFIGLAIIALIRMFLVYLQDRKKVLLPVIALLLAVMITMLSGNSTVLHIVLAAIGGMGVNADHILTAGIAGNVVMILNNFFMTLFSEPDIFEVEYQDRHFMLLGNNTLFVSKMNNFSSTDFASHYFWIIAAYLWVRGKKITWGEVFALGALDILVYSLTASKTTLLCIGLLVGCAFFMRIKGIYDERFGAETDRSNKAVRLISKIFVFCCRYSYLIFAAACIILAILFTCSSPFFLRLNDELHWRLSLGHRAIAEYGIHWINADIPIYGMSSSVDGFYNFLDCSYVAILIRNGFLALVLYLTFVSSIQYRHRKYVYGVVILAVCALSCVEEHHLSELPYNFFLLLTFADLNADRKAEESVLGQKKVIRNTIYVVSFLLCGCFMAASVAIYYPMYKAVKNLDRLDNRALEIYDAVQDNLDAKAADGSWQQATSSMSSDMYGEKLYKPDDFEIVTGDSWSSVTADPKAHSYYSIYYSAQESDISSDPILEMMITDDVKELIGDGSIIIEYDVISGDIYSVWYAEAPGCYVIEDGRRSDRAGRFRSDVKLVEGYTTGVADV